MPHLKIGISALALFAMTLSLEGGLFLRETLAIQHVTTLKHYEWDLQESPLNFEMQMETGAMTGTQNLTAAETTGTSTANESQTPAVTPSGIVTIVAFGDMMLDRYVWTLMERHGHDYPFEYFPELLESMMQGFSTSNSSASKTVNTSQAGTALSPDFIFANLEGPISDSNYINPGTAMVFNFKPSVTEMLNKYGFNLLSLANNHAYDMGETGVTQTRQYLTKAGIHHFGDARAIKEESVWMTEVNGVRLAFVGFNDTVSDHLDYAAANTLIADLEPKVDFTILSIHWGTEYRTTPTQQRMDHAHGFVAAGADVVLGHHPHVIEFVNESPVEWFEGPEGARPIYYSLGNFIFDQYFQQNVQEGLGVVLQLEKSKESISTHETVFDILKSQAKRRK